MNMDKKQVKQHALSILNHYFPEAKKELARIKKIADSQKRREEAESAHRKHSSHSQLVTGYYNSYNLSGEINSDSIVEYERIVNELRDLSHNVQDNQGQSQTNRLSHCTQECLNS